MLSELQEVDLVPFHFLSISYFSFYLFIFPFLFFAPRVRVNDGMGHMAQRKTLEE